MIEPNIKPTAASGLKRFLHVILNSSKSFSFYIPHPSFPPLTTFT